jgi:hypothetical protein
MILLGGNRSLALAKKGHYSVYRGKKEIADFIRRFIW